MADLSFPWEMFMQATQQKNQNRNQANQDIANIGGGLGQGFNSIGQAMQRKKQKDQWSKTINQLMNDPSTTPQMKQMLPMVAQQPELAEKLFSQAKPTSPWRVVPNMFSNDGKPIQQNEQTGEVRKVDIDAKTSSPRANAMQSRTDYLNKSLDYRQRDLLNKNTNLPGQQLKVLTQNNMRADRAIDLIGSPNVTWQKLNFAITDLGAIMQGGVPHKEQILDAQFPSWKQKVAQYRTFATGQPTANVPEPIRQEVMGMIQSLKKVDNEFLQQNMQNQMKMLGPTVQGFDKLKPIIEQGTQNFMQGTQQPQGGPYSDPGKEARYRAWKEAHP